jgi:hypothetical protein
MSILVTNTAALPPPSLCMEAEPRESPSTSLNDARLYSFSDKPNHPKVAAMSANFLRPGTGVDFDRGCACLIVSHRLFGHRFGGLPAPGGNSPFCFGCAALRVTVSLQIFFCKYIEKICPDPP